MAETVICSYRIRAGDEAAFMALLPQHWPVLHRLELVTDAAPRYFRRIDEPAGSGEIVEIVEIFEWISGDAAAVAHTHPDVSVVWERMGALADDMHFPHYEELHR